MEDKINISDEMLYRQFVFQMFEKESSERFSNGAPIHAIFIFEAMLLFARKSVKIFCNNLSKEVFSEPRIFMALERAMTNNVSINVMTQNSPEETPFVKKLRDKGLLKVTKNEEIKKIPINFAVMDDKAFRYEKNAAEIKAFACANEPSSAHMLSNDFDVIYAM